nr:MAG TPA: Rad50 zinc hook motif [Caudoviricetes sp.]
MLQSETSFCPTCGLFGFGWLIDCFSRSFRDKYGFWLRR